MMSVGASSPAVEIHAFRHAEACQAIRDGVVDEELIEKILKNIPEGDFKESIRAPLMARIGEVYKGVITGSSGPSKTDPLSKDGIIQAEQLGDRMCELYPNLTVLYTSDLTRCVQTAEIIKMVFKQKLDKEISIVVHKGLREIKHRYMDGLIPAGLRNLIYNYYYGPLIAAQEGKAIDPNIKCTSNPPGFNGETFEQVGERGRKALVEIAKDSLSESPKVIITSNSIIKKQIIDSLHEKKPFVIKPLFFEKFEEFTDGNYIENGSGNKFIVEDEKVTFIEGIR